MKIWVFLQSGHVIRVCECPEYWAEETVMKYVCELLELDMKEVCCENHTVLSCGR